MELSTSYLGLTLKNPFIVGASPLSDTAAKARRAEDAGAAALVAHSLFEEQIIGELAQATEAIDTPSESFAEATSYFAHSKDFKFRLGPDEYLEHLRHLKEAVDIPVIGSLNGVTPGGWTDYARRIQEAGVDALELNVYFLPTGDSESGEQVERRVVEVLRGVRQAVRIPVALKLSPFFSSLPHFLRRLEGEGAQGAVLFNRFYQPDIDVEELETLPKLTLSESTELLLRLRWLAILWGRTGLSLAATGGVHTAEDAIKAVMAGAHAVQMVSALLRNGVEHLGQVRDEMSAWMDRHEYESLDQMRGSMSLLRCPNPSALERANYVGVLQRGY